MKIQLLEDSKFFYRGLDKHSPRDALTEKQLNIVDWFMDTWIQPAIESIVNPEGSKLLKTDFALELIPGKNPKVTISYQRTTFTECYRGYTKINCPEEHDMDDYILQQIKQIVLDNCINRDIAETLMIARNYNMAIHFDHHPELEEDPIDTISMRMIFMLPERAKFLGLYETEFDATKEKSRELNKNKFKVDLDFFD